MLNRDFNKSAKDYLTKNRIWLIIVASIISLGLILGLVLGFNTNYEIKGYNEFSVSINNEARTKFTSYANEIETIVNNYGGDCDNIALYGEGDNSKIIVRYMNTISNDKIDDLDAEIVVKLSVDESDISSHTKVKGEVDADDYIYTAGAILIIIAIASIFCYVRYNGASAITIMLASMTGSLGMISLTAILRLTVGFSYFAMILLLNMLIVYFAIDVFEKMREGSYLRAKDYSNAIQTAMKENKFKLCLVSVAILVLGLIFVIVAPNAIKYLALNIMFLSVVFLAVIYYIVPFVWSLLITKSKKIYKVHASSSKDDKGE